MYIKFINGATVFPYSAQQLVEDNPKTIFERPLSDATLAAHGVYPVHLADEPAHDRATHRAEMTAPALVGDRWVRDWIVRQATAEEVAEYKEQVAAVKQSLVNQVDDAVAVKIAKSTRFAIGYQEREAAARAFKDAGYQGDPTSWVSRFAGNVGMTNQAAADLILAQADALRAALAELENLRMDKYLIAAAPSVDQAHQVAARIVKDIAAVVIP